MERNFKEGNKTSKYGCRFLQRRLGLRRWVFLDWSGHADWRRPSATCVNAQTMASTAFRDSLTRGSAFSRQELQLARKMVKSRCMNGQYTCTAMSSIVLECVEGMKRAKYFLDHAGGDDQLKDIAYAVDSSLLAVE